MNQTSFEFVLSEARKLSLQEQRHLVKCLRKEIREESLAIVQRTRGRIKGFDRETRIQIAEGEEYCMYAVGVEEDMERFEKQKSRKE